ncbi:hypothetical protein GBAR_LOCUS5603, partial [Geodia barretti]
MCTYTHGRHYDKNDIIFYCNWFAVLSTSIAYKSSTLQEMNEHINADDKTIAVDCLALIGYESNAHGKL